MKKQQGSIFILLLLGTVIFAASALVFVITQRNISPVKQQIPMITTQPAKSPQIINQNLRSPSPTDFNEISTRKQLDFTKILNEEYSIIKDETYGFSLNYPPEAGVYNYTNEENKNKGFTDQFKGDVLKKAINISLTPITSKVATEFYDGLSIDIFFLKNSSNLTLDQFVKNNTQQYDKTESDKNSPDYSQFTKEDITISNHRVIKTVHEDHRSITYQYFLLNKPQTYFIVLELYPVGNDLKQYEKVGDKIISSITLF